MATPNPPRPDALNPYGFAPETSSPIDELPPDATISDPDPTKTGPVAATPLERIGRRLGINRRQEPSTPHTPTDTTSRFEPSGNPQIVGETIAGLLILAAATAATWISRRGARLRQPLPNQADAIGQPLASILCRHFPMAKIGPDIADAARTARGIADYATDGPMLTPIDPDPDPDEEL